MRFHLVDRLVELELGRRALAQVTFDPTEELFDDHFPGRPLVPGSLLIEAMAQAGGWLVLATDEFRRWPLLVLVERAKFRDPTPPGVSIELEAELEGSLRGSTVRLPTTARVGSRTVAQATCVFRLFPPGELAPSDDGESFGAWARSRYEELVGPGAARP